MASISNDSLILDSAHSSEQGVRPRLEDCVVDIPMLKVSSSKCTSGQHALYAIFDGHGDDSVAKACIEYLPKILSDCLKKYDDINKALNTCICVLDETILKNVKSSNRAGTVAVIGLIDIKDKKLWVINVGDSRCILISQDNNNNDDVKALSSEHRPEKTSELNRIQKAGGFIGSTGYVMNSLAMTRAIGDGEIKKINPNVIISTPDIQYHKLNINDKYLILGCDGLWDVLSNEEVEDYLLKYIINRPNITLKEVCSNLVKDAIEKYKSMDNVTVIIVKLHELNNEANNKDESNNNEVNNEVNDNDKNKNDHHNNNNNNNNNNNDQEK